MIIDADFIKLGPIARLGRFTASLWPLALIGTLALIAHTATAAVKPVNPKEAITEPEPTNCIEARTIQRFIVRKGGKAKEISKVTAWVPCE